MQATSQSWKNLIASGSYLLQTSAEINGVSYEATTAPVVTRGLTDGSSFTVGGCSAASLSLSLVTTDDIPTAAEVRVYMRLIAEGEVPAGGELIVSGDTLIIGGQPIVFASYTASEWLPIGTFYISKRDRDWITNLVTIQAYDSMLRINQTFSSVSTWPRTMAQTVEEIAALMEVEVDSRTWEHIPTFSIPDPTGSLISVILGEIGALAGGNWIITPEGKLRLVPLAGQPAAADCQTIEGILQKLTIGDTVTVSGVRGTDPSGTVYSAGTDAGYVLDIGTNTYVTQALIDALNTKVNGIVHIPYKANGAIYDPALELGDPVMYASLVRSVLMNETCTYGVAFRSDASAPVRDESESEYPFQSATALSIAALRKAQDANITFDVLSSVDETQNTTTLTAKVYRNGEDVTAEFEESRFAWIRKTEKGTETIGTGYSITVSNDDFAYGGAVVGRLTTED